MRFAAPLPLAASFWVIGTNTNGSDSVVGGLWIIGCESLETSGVSSIFALRCIDDYRE